MERTEKARSTMTQELHQHLMSTANDNNLMAKKIIEDMAGVLRSQIEEEMYRIRKSVEESQERLAELSSAMDGLNRFLMIDTISVEPVPNFPPKPY